MIAASEAQVAAWLAARSERCIETACARIFLAGDKALKIKRRVNLGYLDFSTLEARAAAIGRELVFNREAAPDLYLETRTVTQDPAGELALDGEGQVVDHVLVMRRFDDGAVLGRAPDRIDEALAEALGRMVARLHVHAPTVPPGEGGGASALAYTIGSNAELLRNLSDDLGKADVEALVEATWAELERQRPLLERRLAAGLSRRCHADLHLENILLEEGGPVAFDCIEFSDRLSRIDIQYDLAFLLMDLVVRGRPQSACLVMSAYFDEALRSFGLDLLDGLAAMPLMLSVRAAVRAHVCAHSDDPGGARTYLAAALNFIAPQVRPRLVCVGGYSGTGKTTFARQVLPGLGAPPGALLMRTDEVRKRQAGAASRERLPAGAYGPGARRGVYLHMFEEAARALRAGASVVLDATFLDPRDRDDAAALAKGTGARFTGLWLEAPEAVLLARIAARRNDASDADAQALRGQLDRGPGPLDWIRIDASGEARDAAAAFLKREGGEQPCG